MRLKSQHRFTLFILAYYVRKIKFTLFYNAAFNYKKVGVGIRAVNGSKRCIICGVEEVLFVQSLYFFVNPVKQACVALLHGY